MRPRGGHFALVAQTVAVLDRTGEDVSYGFNTAVRVPWKSRDIIAGIVVAEIVQQEKRIEILGFAEAEGALQLDPRAFDGRLRLNDLFN